MANSFTSVGGLALTLHWYVQAPAGFAQLRTGDARIGETVSVCVIVADRARITVAWVPG